jgi:hypothetical protein
MKIKDKSEKVKEEKCKDPKRHEKMFYRLQECVKHDENEKGYILDSKNTKHEELKEYFKFNSTYQANMVLKVWIKELERDNIEDESDEDAMIKFFQIRYFMTSRDKLIEGENKLKGLGENS